MKLVTVQIFDNPVDLHLLRSKLDSEGIHCFVFDEHIVSLNPLFSNSVGGIKLKVAEKDEEIVRSILQELKDAPNLDENNQTIACPKCASTDLYINYRSMKGYKGLLSMATMFLFTAFPFYFKNVYKCKSCGTEFR